MQAEKERLKQPVNFCKQTSGKNLLIFASKEGKKQTNKQVAKTCWFLQTNKQVAKTSWFFASKEGKKQTNEQVAKTCWFLQTNKSTVAAWPQIEQPSPQEATLETKRVYLQICSKVLTRIWLRFWGTLSALVTYSTDLKTDRFHLWSEMYYTREI